MKKSACIANSEIPQVVYTADRLVDWDKIVRGAVIKYENHYKTFYGLVINTSGNFATVLRVAVNPIFCQNKKTKISGINVVSNNEGTTTDNHANIFSGTITVRFDTVVEICGMCNMTDYFNIISALAYTYLGFYHIDDNGNYILDDVYVKDPITAMMFGMMDLPGIHKSNKDKAEKEAKKQEEAIIQEVKKNPAPKRSKYVRSIPDKIDIEKDMHIVYSTNTKDRIDAIYGYFSDYLVDDRLPVAMVYNWMFKNKPPKNRIKTVRVGCFTKEEFAFIVNSSQFEIIKKFDMGDSYAKALKNKVTCIFNGAQYVSVSHTSSKITPKHIDPSVLEDDINKYILNYKSVKDLVKFLTTLPKYKGMNEKSFYTMVLNLMNSSKRSTTIQERIDNILKAKWIDKFLVNYTSDDVKEIINQMILTEDYQQYIDGAKIIKHDDMRMRIILNYTIFRSVYKNDAFRFLLLKENKDICEWINKQSVGDLSTIHSLTSDSQNSVMMKIVCHYVCAGKKEIDSLLPFADNPASMARYMYPLCRATQSASLAASMISRIIGINKDTIFTAITYIPHLKGAANIV